MMMEPIRSLFFIFERLDVFGVIDILLVTLIFFVVFLQFRGTQAATILRGVAILIAIVILLSSLTQLPAFSWILSSILPALLIVIPVVFAPEIRRTLERVGRADFLRRNPPSKDIPDYLHAVVAAAQRLSERRHGALIVLERAVKLEDFISTGLRVDAVVSPEILLQTFYPNSPLHDGAAIIRGGRLQAVGCVVPLSSSDSVAPSPERRMGLRHRAAVGISEVSDAVAVVVSEETGIISIAHNGRMIRRLDSTRLQNIIVAFSRETVLFASWNPLSLFQKKKPKAVVTPTVEGREGRRPS